MTLIACTLNYKNPFLVGDLLISSRKMKESIQLPTNTINITDYLEPGKAVATGLYQKIYIINKNVAIALAGDVSEMTMFLEEFKIRCSYYNPIDEKGIGLFVEGYDFEKNFANSAFFIMLMVRESESISVKQFWSPKELWRQSTSEIFEKVYACGTGADDFLHNALKQKTLENSFEKGNIYQALAKNFGFIAKLLAIERASLYTVKNNWGGGFETIIFDGNSFVKIDEIAYITCLGEFDDKGDKGLPSPQLIQYYKYYKDVLFISSIEVKSWRREEKGDQIILQSDNYRASLFCIPRIDLKKGSSIELPSGYSFTTNRVALGYAIAKNNSVFAPSSFTESNRLNVTYHDAKYIEVILSKEITSRIISSKANETFLLL